MTTFDSELPCLCGDYTEHCGCDAALQGPFRRPPPIARAGTNVGDPLGYEAARAIAESLLDEQWRSQEDCPEIVIPSDGIFEFHDLWAFCYQSREWLETQDEMSMLLENAPIFVDKATGDAWWGRTDVGVREQAANVRR